MARDQISAAGVDPDGELTYEHFFYFADEVDARAAADDLVPDFSVEVFEPGDGISEWGVVAVQSAALDASGLEGLTARLDTVARRHNGEYDGWGVPLGD